MKVTKLELYNYRNFNNLAVEFGGEKIGLLGANGLGKTNILEALYVLSTGTSWRSLRDFELISHREMSSRLSCVVEKESESFDLSLALARDPIMGERSHKRYFVNGVPRTKKVFTSKLFTLLFVPEDLLCVAGAPGIRRSYLDRFLVSLFDDYHLVLTRYQRVLTNRNRLLEKVREREAQMDQLDYWTEQMVELGSEIYSHRLAFFRRIEEVVDNVYSVLYKPNIVSVTGTRSSEEIKVLYQGHIMKNLHKEVLTAQSQYGPHKDDFGFVINDQPASQYASRGQQRSALLWFIHSQLEYFVSILGESPVVLLDDMFSELDANHRKDLLTMFSGYQVFVTGCEPFYFSRDAGVFDVVYEVSSGNISEL